MAQLIRFVVLAAALFYGLFKLRRLFRPRRSRTSRGRSSQSLNKGRIVKDLACETYIPETEALTLADDGEVFYFCSEECRQKYRLGRQSHQARESRKTFSSAR